MYKCNSPVRKIYLTKLYLTRFKSKLNIRKWHSRKIWLIVIFWNKFCDYIVYTRHKLYSSLQLANYFNVYYYNMSLLLYNEPNHHLYKIITQASICPPCARSPLYGTSPLTNTHSHIKAKPFPTLFRDQKADSFIHKQHAEL